MQDISQGFLAGCEVELTSEASGAGEEKNAGRRLIFIEEIMAY